MKTKHLVATIVLTVVFVAGALNVYHQSQKDQMSDTALANIEALAGDDQGGEGSISIPCTKLVDCKCVVYAIDADGNEIGLPIAGYVRVE